MESEKDIHQWIERYLDGLLEHKEIAAFEQKLATDVEFQQALDLAKQARQSVSLAGRRHLKSRLEGFEKEITTKSTSIFSSVWFWSLIFFVAFLIITILWFGQSKQERTPAQIYAAQFEAYQAPLNLRSTSSSLTENWTQAKRYYQQQNFEQAIPLFQSLSRNDTSMTYLAQFYLGQSLLAQASPDANSAIAAFDQVIRNDNDYRQQAIWYKALAYLQLEDVEAAKALFRAIVKQDFYKKESAKQILEQLE